MISNSVKENVIIIFEHTILKQNYDKRRERERERERDLCMGREG